VVSLLDHRILADEVHHVVTDPDADLELFRRGTSNL